MSLSESSKRRHGLAYVRRQIEAGQYLKKDLKRWRKEFGAAAVDAMLPPDDEPTDKSPDGQE